MKGGSVNEALAALADEYWDYVLETSPTQALMLGVHDHDGRHEDVSREAEDSQISRLNDFVARADAIPTEGLTADERITVEVLIFEASSHARMAEGRFAEMDVNHAVGFQAMLPVAIPQLPLVTPEHAEAMPSKYRGVARQFDDAIERLRQGLANGRAPMSSTAAKAVSQVDGYLSVPFDSDPLLALRAPQDWDGESAWRESMVDVARDTVRPALQRWRDFVTDEVIPSGRSEEEPGLSYLPDGEDLYSRTIFRYTTLDMDPETVHQVGLDQVAKLDDEYRELGSDVLGTSDLQEIYSRLREDPELHFSDGPSIVAASEAALAKAKAAMTDWFGKLPQSDCLVKETPSGPLGFYFRPASDGSRPGMFFINTSDPAAWGTYEIESFAFHEGIPGHHLQLAIAGELTGIPEFRKQAFISAYGEGWGLYTERLADEMGLYGSPLDRIGMLSADSTRASRLVVDTGIHAMGWSRQRAIDYMMDNSPNTLFSVAEEVDRYIGMPGQALSYMLGRLEIQRMRREAEASLGAGFDIKGFHDTVLGSGLVPLTTLDRMVSEWGAGG
jgi:uncharacterized protein (DUF885 family)